MPSKKKRAKRNSSAVIRIAPPPPRPWELNAEEVELVKKHICPGASDLELQFNLTVARRHKLDPFRGQIWFVPRRNDGTRKWIPIVGINGLLHIAARDHADFGSVGDPEYGPMMQVEYNVWKEVRGHWEPTEKKKLMVPEWARAKVLKKGMTEPTVATVYWEEIYPDLDFSPMVRQMRRHMLGKCSVAHAIRRAYPSTDGLYISEEFAGRPDYTREGREIVYPERAITYSEEKKEAVDNLRSRGDWCEEHNCSKSLKHMREFHFDEIGTKPDKFEDRLQAAPRNAPTGDPAPRPQSSVQRGTGATAGPSSTPSTTRPVVAPKDPKVEGLLDSAKKLIDKNLGSQTQPKAVKQPSKELNRFNESPTDGLKPPPARIPMKVKSVKWTTNSKGLAVELETGKWIYCFRNHKMGEDKEELFNLLVLAPGKTCIFLLEDSKFKDGKPFTQILRLLQMGDREWDETGMPILRREPATRKEREPGEDSEEQWLK